MAPRNAELRESVPLCPQTLSAHALVLSGRLQTFTVLYSPEHISEFGVELIPLNTGNLQVVSKPKLMFSLTIMRR